MQLRTGAGRCLALGRTVTPFAPQFRSFSSCVRCTDLNSGGQTQITFPVLYVNRSATPPPPPTRSPSRSHPHVPPAPW